MTLPSVLVIAGSDPSGKAGVLADLAVLANLGVDGVSAVTAVAVQNDDEVLAIHPTPADVLTQQIAAATKGKKLAAVKIGMVATRANARAIAWFLRRAAPPHVVIDPVLHASSGAPLLDANALPLYRQRLLPLATVLTPNLAEASALAGMQVAGLDTMRSAALAIHQELAELSGNAHRMALVVKGGHLEGEAVDLLFDGMTFHEFSAARIPANPRGTGCRFASAIAALLAKGEPIIAAVPKAKAYLAGYLSQTTP